MANKMRKKRYFLVKITFLEPKTKITNKHTRIPHGMLPFLHIILLNFEPITTNMGSFGG
jgi:hypothetical protein